MLPRAASAPWTTTSSHGWGGGHRSTENTQQAPNTAKATESTSPPQCSHHSPGEKFRRVRGRKRMKQRTDKRQVRGFWRLQPLFKSQTTVLLGRADLSSLWSWSTVSWQPGVSSEVSWHPFYFSVTFLLSLNLPFYGQMDLGNGPQV